MPKDNDYGGYSLIFHFAALEDAEKMLARLRELGVSNDCAGHLLDEENLGGFLVVDDADGLILSDQAYVLMESAYAEAERLEEEEVQAEEMGGERLTIPTVYALMPTEACFTEDGCWVPDGVEEGAELAVRFLDPNLQGAVARGELTLPDAYRMQFGRYMEEHEEEEEEEHV